MDDDDLPLVTRFYKALNETLDRHLEKIRQERRGPIARAAIVIDYLAHFCPRFRSSDQDILDALTLIEGNRKLLDMAEGDLLKKARGRGISYSRISSALGLKSRQAAEQRFLKLQVGDSSAEDSYLDLRRRERLNSAARPAEDRKLWTMGGLL